MNKWLRRVTHGLGLKRTHRSDVRVFQDALLLYVTSPAARADGSGVALLMQLTVTLDKPYPTQAARLAACWALLQARQVRTTSLDGGVPCQ